MYKRQDRSLGVPTKVERGKRVFPVSDSAADVAEALLKYMKKNGVRLHLEKAVKDIIIEDGRAVGVVLADGKRAAADAVIVATGGLSLSLIHIYLYCCNKFLL